MRQASLRFRTWGGRRRGAGRPPKDDTAGVPHLRRPALARRFPVHITLRVRREVWNLRSRRCYTAIRRALADGNRRFGFRLNEFSVQGNHLHLLAEAEHATSLSRGTQGLEIRIARKLNRVMGRSGKVFADRYHARILRTPTEVRRALNYVLQNSNKHFGRRGVDPCSSAAAEGAAAVIAPRTWLLKSVPP